MTFDGTPSFAEAEAIVVHLITKQWKVVEPLDRCQLSKQKLKSKELGHHGVNTIVNCCQLSLNNWVSVHQDRAATNKSRLCEICDEFHEGSPTQNYCCSHGLSNTGKQALEVDGAARYAEMFRKQWQ